MREHFEPLWGKDRTTTDLLRETRNLADYIRDTVSIFPDDSPHDEATRKALATTDPVGWMNVYMPHYFEAEAAAVHREWLEAMEEGRRVKAMTLLATPRGHAKSTVMTFGDTIRTAVLGQFHYQMVISKTETHSSAITLAIRQELTHNPRILQDYGPQKSGNWSESFLVLANDCAIQARGYKQQVRGMRHRQYRPDCIRVDDIDDKAIAKNPKTTKDIFELFKTEYFPALDKESKCFVFVSNVFSSNCVMARCLSDTDGHYVVRRHKALENPKWDNEQRCFTAGTPLWPEYYGLHDLSVIRDAIGDQAWEAEYQNNPNEHLKRFPRKFLRRVRVADLPDLVHYLGIDPSYTDEGHPKAQVLVGTDGTKKYVRYARIRQESDLDMMDATFWIYLKFNPIKVIFETVGLQKIYLREYHYVSQGLTPQIGNGRYTGVWLPLVDHPQTLNKIARINAMGPAYERGDIVFCQGTEEEVGDMEVLIEQLIEHPNAQVFNDGPDALQMADEESQEMHGLIPVVTTVVRGRYSEEPDRLPREAAGGRFGTKRGLY